ncbi:MAG: hypothetical protein MHM6MM_001562 [Cercozoa sp. M6MM]
MWDLETNLRGRAVWQWRVAETDWEKSVEKEQQEMLGATSPETYEVYPSASDMLHRHLRLRRLELQSTVCVHEDKENSAKVETEWPPASFEQPLSLQEPQFPNDPIPALERGMAFYERLQDPNGCWQGDYGGPMFLLPGVVIAAAITGILGTEEGISSEACAEMRRYLKNHQSTVDGGWGLHVEDAHSTMFGTALNYVALRLLGAAADDPVCARARAFIHKHGGADGVPHWGKFWLSVLGVYEWHGMHSLWPEMWSLPSFVPAHPSKMWCHTRQVYLPMGYCYAKRIQANASADTPLGETLRSLRRELYTVPYHEIDWKAACDKVAAPDDYRPASKWLTLSFKVMDALEWCANTLPGFKTWRRRAADWCFELIDAEDRHTFCVDIGPVSKAINMICVWHRLGAESDHFRRHVDRLRDYLWLAEDGMKCQGYNGSQLWDCTFAVMALCEAGEPIVQRFRPCLERAFGFVERQQMVQDIVPEGEHERYYRHITKGAWPFSTTDNGWPVSDCTAHGMKAVMALRQAGVKEPFGLRVTDERLRSAVDFVLTFQNTDGGFSPYEPQRAGTWLETFNPSGVFADIMVDYSYIELTASVCTALLRFREQVDGDYRRQDIETALRRGIDFVKQRQRKDGSWYGSWGVGFTYAAFFGVDMLRACGETWDTSEHLRKACEFLVTKQNEDGGWGEHFNSCVKYEYHDHPEGSQIVQTAWALMALAEADCPRDAPEDYETAMRKAAAFLESKQQADGDWPQDAITGVFNGSCMITYTAYRNVFPLTALARWRNWLLRNVETSAIL